MKVNLMNFIDIEIDRLTNSICCCQTGEEFATIVEPLVSTDLKKVRKKLGWRFDWNREFNYTDRITYKLCIEGRPEEIMGLVSCTKDEGHYLLQVIENAPFNVGRYKQYDGVAGNLFAFVCKLSKNAGFGGVIAFFPKSILAEHYIEKLKAQYVGKLKLGIFEKEAESLINKYFN